MAIRRPLALAAMLLVAVAGGAPLARADGGPGPGGGDRGERTEARARGACPGGGSWDLRLRGEDGSIALDVRVAAGRRVRAGRWRVVVVHERRIAWRGSPSASSTMRVRRALPDYDGPDALVVRATPPGGVACVAEAALPARS
jgi:hypothetical protein